MNVRRQERRDCILTVRKVHYRLDSDIGVPDPYSTKRQYSSTSVTAVFARPVCLASVATKTPFLGVHRALANAIAGAPSAATSWRARTTRRPSTAGGRENRAILRQVNRVNCQFSVGRGDYEYTLEYPCKGIHKASSEVNREDSTANRHRGSDSGYDKIRGQGRLAFWVTFRDKTIINLVGQIGSGPVRWDQLVALNAELNLLGMVKRKD